MTVSYASSHDIVQQNVIKNTMLTLADGGAIYTGSGSSYVTIQNNFISDVIGNNEGTDLWGGTYQSWTGAMGIYMDSGSRSTVLSKIIQLYGLNLMHLMMNCNTYNHTIRGTILPMTVLRMPADFFSHWH